MLFARLQALSTLYALPSLVACRYEPLCTPHTFLILYATRTVTQYITPCLKPTQFQNQISAICSLKATMANVIVNHVTAGAFRTVAQLKSQYALSTHGQQVLRSRVRPARQLVASEEF